MNPKYISALIRSALREDLGRAGDITTSGLLPKHRTLTALICAKEKGVLCGAAIAREVFRCACPGARVRILTPDGSPLTPGRKILRVTGSRDILSAERTALNFLQRLSGIATLTSAFVKKAAGTRAHIYDTRKTTPALRVLEKYAVRCGGGQNHRMGLYDSVMIKDNHIQALARKESSGSALRALQSFVARRRKAAPQAKITMEAKNASEIGMALALKADVILLDNMSPRGLRKAVQRIRAAAEIRKGRVEIEASGSVTLKNVRRVAETGVDRISIGALTHSAPALDLSLNLIEQ
ncbi:MAG: nicotinate-nucleotide diphosphorylase (carboxylating) [Elusimicrobia bacterium RIFCSPLOWO2_12_FULL_59_9]|nr:MAG: nicotinate-nucleotide diphosphorylase (carboxylating) [Elusimicrobia bacterium RIFCSPLOWO2_12_FULL_59_9]